MKSNKSLFLLYSNFVLMVVKNKQYRRSKGSHQSVFPSGTIPQSHTIIRSSSEEVKSITSEAQSIHSAVVSRVH